MIKRITTFTLPPAATGRALASYLAERFPYHDHAGWCARIAAGRVTLNGRAAHHDTTLAAGDTLAYDVADIPEPPVDFNITIIAEDHDLLVVSKSGNLPCHPGGRYFNHTLWAWLKERAGLTHPEFVNRIDRETSGLVVVAKNAAAAANCRKQFAARQVEKRYHALVESASFPAAITCRGWLAADPASAIRKKQRFIAADTPTAAPPAAASHATTEFRLLRQHRALALVEARPLTGRLHQIRATLLAIGHPLVGDKLYGIDETTFIRFCQGALSDADQRRLRLPRQALHASSLTLRHPRHARPVTLTAPLPNDMALLAQSG